jgi:hydroxyacylglutathione hydrolase
MMELRHCPVGPWSANAYALVCRGTGKSVLIDPGADPDALQLLLEDSQPTAILVTHSHFDHIGALEEMRRTLKVPVMGHPGGAKENHPSAADIWLQGGERLQVGDRFVTVTHTPGHTDDHLCFGIEGDTRIIVGDAVFEGGPGKTWTTGQFQATLSTLCNIVLDWSDDVLCHPGHGAPFRLGAIRKKIELFVAREHGNFYGDATW